MGGVKVFFDTEFIEDGHTIGLISIGLVTDDGREYYAEVAECDRSRASDWVVANVFPYLTGPVKPKAQIAKEIVEFVGPSPEFWAYYADYDWVALCQMFGTMMDLPKGWPMFCRDLMQLSEASGADLVIEQDEPEHNALHDARWVAKAYKEIAA